MILYLLKKKISILNIFIQDVATSIDALCIGFTYINYKVSDAMIVFTIIGITTFLLSCATGLSAKYVGKYIDKYAPLIAGLVFIIVAIKIIVEAFIWDIVYLHELFLQLLINL